MLGRMPCTAELGVPGLGGGCCEHFLVGCIGGLGVQTSEDRPVENRKLLRFHMNRNFKFWFCVVDPLTRVLVQLSHCSGWSQGGFRAPIPSYSR